MRRHHADEHGSSVFVSRLRRLFDEVTYVDDSGRRRRYSNSYVGERTGLSRSYIDGLRNGRNTNPGLNVLTALAGFFNDHRAPDTAPVTVSFLAGDDGESHSTDDETLRARLIDRDVRAIALRAGEASPLTRRQILAMLDVLEDDAPRRGQPDSTN
ncbi:MULTISPECIES: helix-turn-helix domain-containing protein [unclassified Actinopolyspora]|uniref:helix-turn-helix domain-containing protein n=1 Tax=Actinopolyspora TaxID=1849 RepID=UPI0013F62F84|nr:MULTISPECIES: helix-turn-helix domain-containing protein [unclassified Actinopolyspora]NHD15898.1 helix-turn-helix transcriptional regulator [Actinopolyspora sp. BKK2]NHE74888.1 helix-turn-helix transcriptional regulator [Actinopolyspora sp. BKK1]